MAQFPEEEKQPIEEPVMAREEISLPVIPEPNKIRTSNLEDDLGNQLTKTQKTDLTDAGATTLHKHDHGGLDGLADDDHSAVYLSKTNTTAFTPTANYHPATKKYADDLSLSITTAYVASDTVQWTHDDLKTANGATYSKIKSITLAEALPAVRVLFDMWSSSGELVYGQIWKNGSPIGTERSTTSAGAVTYNEDFTSFAAGDEIGIYGHVVTADGRTVNISTFDLKFDRTQTKLGNYTYNPVLVLTGFNTNPTNWSNS